MLSNVAPPLLIFNFSKMFGADLSWASFLSETIKIGVPVPVPLSKSFGLVDKGDKNTFSIRTENFGDKILQRGMDHEVTATYTCRKDSSFAQIVLPLVQKCFEFMNSPDFEYDVSYINGETLVFNGKISDYQSFPNAENNNLLDITFTITTNPASLGFDTSKNEATDVKIMSDAGKVIL